MTSKGFVNTLGLSFAIGCASYAVTRAVRYMAFAISQETDLTIKEATMILIVIYIVLAGLSIDWLYVYFRR